jgi:hypothetical protein
VAGGAVQRAFVAGHRWIVVGADGIDVRALFRGGQAGAPGGREPPTRQLMTTEWREWGR